MSSTSSNADVSTVRISRELNSLGLHSPDTPPSSSSSLLPPHIQCMCYRSVGGVAEQRQQQQSSTSAGIVVIFSLKSRSRHSGDTLIEVSHFTTAAASAAVAASCSCLRQAASAASASAFAFASPLAFASASASAFACPFYVHFMSILCPHPTFSMQIMDPNTQSNHHILHPLGTPKL
jgi:hypothetical protein